jgi:hypothetical protein
MDHTVGFECDAKYTEEYCSVEWNTLQSLILLDVIHYGVRVRHIWFSDEKYTAEWESLVWRSPEVYSTAWNTQQNKDLFVDALSRLSLV